jgi:hypothetical protein
MLPFICRCCGMEMENRAPWNPNVCIACAGVDWADLPPPRQVVPKEIPSSTEVPQELEEFLPWEGPSLIECFDAAEQAQQAINEMNATELHGSSEAPLPSTTRAR